MLTVVNPKDDYYLSRKELAERWVIGQSTLALWDEQGTNPVLAYKLGPGKTSQIRYRFSEVVEAERMSVIQLPGA